MITESIAKRVFQALDLPLDTSGKSSSRPCDTTDLLSCFQLAFLVQRGGYDYVLARYADDVFARLCNVGRRIGSPLKGASDCWIALRRPMKLSEGSRTMLELRGHSSPASPARLSGEEIRKMLALGVPLKVCCSLVVFIILSFLEQVFQELFEDELGAISRIPTDRDQALRFVRDELGSRPTNFDNECEDCSARWGSMIIEQQI